MGNTTNAQGLSPTGGATVAPVGSTGPNPAEGGAAGLAYQRYQMGIKATGADLGVGLRSAPPPSAQFSNPPQVSAAQFAGAANPRLSLGG